jgi:protease secretion system membrane fusion protein
MIPDGSNSTRSRSPLQKIAQTFNPYTPETLVRDGVSAVRIEESSAKRLAARLVTVVFVIFLIWAVTAPLDQGTVVPGTVVVLGQRKAVQHPSGGVVEEIRVREGDEVQQGDVLLRINPLNVDANLRQAENDFISALAIYSRLLAERLDSPSITWDPELLALAKIPQALEARQLQQALFRSRRAEYKDQREILSRQGEGLQQQLRDKQHILELRKVQMAPIAADAKSMRELAEAGFVPRLQANSAERADLDAQIGFTTLQAEISSLKVSIAAIELELSKLAAAYNKQVDAELSEAQKSKETLRARVISLRFDQSLTSVRSPASGIVVGLKAHTVGGVISAGQVLMEVVPKERKLIVEAAIPPDKIDKVSVGLETDLRFTAFNQNTTPVVLGRVALVGADRLPPSPPLFPHEYFLSQIEVTPEGQRRLGELAVVPGMPVEVIIKRGERTFMTYLLKPLADRLAISFTEK